MKNQKTVYQYLLTIPGFGEARAKQLLASIGVATTTKMKAINNVSGGWSSFGSWQGSQKPQGPHKPQSQNSQGLLSASQSKDVKLRSFKETLLLQALASLRRASSWSNYNSVPCEFEIEKILLKNKQENIKSYISNLSYHGGRLRFGYPVNGGRTRSNGQTAKKLMVNSLSTKPVQR